MSRLIDADKLKIDFTHIFATVYGRKCAEMFRGVINQQPTAYDVDAVISELQNVAYCKKIPTYNHPYSSGSVIDEDDAIDIVKRGGLNG